jgi:hypothetical protein
MSLLRRSSSFWIKTLLAAGTVLAVALLAQTGINYRYVSESLIEQEARRAAEEHVRAVERAARLARPQDAEAFRALLDDLRGERTDQIAAITLRQGDGAIIATTGEPAAAPMADAQRRVLAARGAPFGRDRRGGRDVFVGMFPCRCSYPGQAVDTPGRQPAAGRLLIELALYRDSLSAPFARLRRDAIISASAALTLLISLSLIAFRFGPYVRGKQLEVQMDLARQVQRDLLPSAGARPAGVDVAAECIPASDVGGDFYDIVSLPGGRVAFVLGDVSGHGISAALLMGLIHGAMSSPHWGVLGDEPDRAARLNQLLLAKTSEARFASLFWCSYEPASRRLRYINAGHVPPLWIRQNPDGTFAVDRLAEDGPVLGLLPGAAYRTVSVEAQAGDLLVLFSDGIVEVANRRDEYFGEERLIAVTKQHVKLPTLALCEAILSAVRTFAGDRPVADDQTLLVVRLPPAGDRL